MAGSDVLGGCEEKEEGRAPAVCPPRRAPVRTIVRVGTHLPGRTKETRFNMRVDDDAAAAAEARCRWAVVRVVCGREGLETTVGCIERTLTACFPMIFTSESRRARHSRWWCWWWEPSLQVQSRRVRVVRNRQSDSGLRTPDSDELPPMAIGHRDSSPSVSPQHAAASTLSEVHIIGKRAFIIVLEYLNVSQSQSTRTGSPQHIYCSPSDPFALPMAARLTSSLQRAGVEIFPRHIAEHL